MKDATPQPVRLSDYAPPAYLVDDVHLTFQLHPTHTIVKSRIRFRPNPATEDRTFQLNGIDMSLRRAAIDGQDWKPHVKNGILSAKVPDAPFTWEAEVEINPAANTVLEGLYMSGGIYCTQCEAEGFRRITYYPDRPDVMAPFTVRIETGQPFKLSNGELVEGDAPLPVVLSNGDLIASGPGWAEWHDPWPKPSYLFALVAGDLVAHSGSFTTMEGREVALNIWVRPGDEDRCAYALDSLKRAMAWDEKVYGRAYDLDIFNLVAVDDFNAGAMENKGLNIFNSKYVLASPETATDRDYELIEGIVAHEYFHNWTGNRITCRDWFQLCLKEGLTVFRDQQFSGDQRSHAVKRISDVQTLRAAQFPEDNGPLAHNVRPEEYYEINNFYTATVYEKGAEVIGMLKRLVGETAYAKALDLYFERHDGQACTIEDWLQVFEDATGHDLAQFKRWYTQAGTPRLTVTDDFNNGTYALHFKQETPPTPGQPDKSPQVLPIAVGLLDASGREVQPTTVLTLTEAEQTFTFDGLSNRPVPSILRGFSAPVILNHDTSDEHRRLLLAHDTDPFNKWEAGRQLAKQQIIAMVTEAAAPDMAFLDALGAMVRDDRLDPAFRAVALALPSENDTAQSLFDAGRTPDPSRIHTVHRALKQAIGAHLSTDLATLYDKMQVTGPYSPDATSAGKRALRLSALSYLSRSEGTGRAQDLFDTATNMTESLGALAAILDCGEGEEQLSTFYERWKNDAGVMDKWFALQIARAAPERAVSIARRLTDHPLFNPKVPNRFRAVIGAMGQNTAGFHSSDGSGYAFVADWILTLDPINPATAARMTTLFNTWRHYDADRQDMIRDQLSRIRSSNSLSGDTAEMVSRMLDG